jgi:peptidoglycan/xylan/chitin deacetylase (PgdA/CDA1 family)
MLLGSTKSCVEWCTKIRKNMTRELILNFHGLGEPPPDTESEERFYWLRTESFSRLLDQVLDHSTKEPKISLTFDDGNASDVFIALPELANRGLTASFFICPGRIGKKNYLDEAMIKELAGAGMRVGSHGMNHQDWRRLDSAGLEVEISGARRKLEDIIGQRVTNVSIPFGSYDRRVLRRLAQEQWEVIYTADGGIAWDTSKLKPRTTVTANLQDRDLLQELVRAPYLHVRLRRALSRIWKRLR